MAAHGDDPAYAKALRESAPECFDAASPDGMRAAPAGAR
jgi:hypothetical protein